MSTFEQSVLWTALPYASFVLLVAGLVWRYRTDQFGWTSRSSQWNESRILR
jgi:nitrate reductase